MKKKNPHLFAEILATLYVRLISENDLLLQDNFYIIIETYHLAGTGDLENVHELEAKKLKQRQVTTGNMLDRVADPDPDKFAALASFTNCVFGSIYLEFFFFK